VLLDIENPKFLRGLRTIQRLAMELDAKRSGTGIARVLALGIQLRIFTTLVSLFLLPVKRNPLPQQTRLAPAW
jgi:magnesium-protoporphyrin IX monomethyl ester (oxidative) cyclase